MIEPVYTHRAYIRATLDEVWDALTNPDMTAGYFFGTRVDCDWVDGSPINYFYPDGRLASSGKIISVDPPHSLERLFLPEWDDELRAEGPVREIWKLASMNGMVELTLEMYDIPVDSAIFGDFTTGFPWIISSMKSLIETGQGLPPPEFA